MSDSEEVNGLAQDLMDIKCSEEHQIPGLNRVLKTLRMDFKKRMQKSEEETSPLARAAWRGSASVVKRILYRVTGEMTQADYRRKYFEKTEREQVCNFCFTWTRALNRTVQLCSAKMCDRCHAMLKRVFE